MSSLCEKCLADRSLCEVCRDNPKYKDYPKESHFQDYIPTCPQGYKDCVFDPAYIKLYYPDWYKREYGDMSPEEAAAMHCDENFIGCYDWEDK